MLSVEHIEQFFVDHPEWVGVQEPIIKRAREAADKDGFISGGEIDRIFSIADDFRRALGGDPKQLEISAQLQERFVASVTLGSAPLPPNLAYSAEEYCDNPGRGY